MIDTIVVGLGIAGISLSQLMLQKGKKIVVFDKTFSCATTVSSGLYNPVFIKYHKKVWQADIASEEMRAFYKKTSMLLACDNKNICQEKNISKVLKENFQRTEWLKHLDRLHPYGSKNIIENHNSAILAPSGLGVIKGSGIIDALLLKKRYCQHLKNKNILIEETFEYDKLHIGIQKIIYKGIHAKNIVFAEGVQSIYNPYFNFLPLRGNKGEWLVIKAPQLRLNHILQSSLFVIPIGKNLYKVGSTYESNYDNDNPSISSKNKLTRLLNTFIEAKWEIINHKSGIRPTVPDRRALLGMHPKYSNLFIINGLGSRGLLMAPFLSKALYNYIEYNTPLLPEVDISRFAV